VNRRGDFRGLGIKLALLFLSLGMSFAAGEVVLRVLTRDNPQGAPAIRSVRLLPYVLPVDAIAEKVEATASRDTYIRYDPDLGWTIRGGARGRDGLLQADPAGIRVTRAGWEVSRMPQPGTTRIALFGDSFTHGDDVPYTETWGAVLEREAKGAGPVEVVNFGVPGYGMDQALLRWRKLGRHYAPQVVVFGLQPENAERNLNLIRPIYWPGTGLPFSKPRFVLESGALSVVNIPAVPPEQLPALLADFEAWEHWRHEFFYHPEDYQRRPLYRSRLLNFLLARLRRPPESVSLQDPGSASGALAAAIIDAFGREVGRSGSRFVVVVLPNHQLLAARRGSSPGLRVLLRDLGLRYQIVDADPVLRAIDVNDVIPPGGHYTPLGNRAIGQLLAERIDLKRSDPHAPP